jgi:hypothetical protein
LAPAAALPARLLLTLGGDATWQGAGEELQLRSRLLEPPLANATVLLVASSIANPIATIFIYRSPHPLQDTEKNDQASRGFLAYVVTVLLGNRALCGCHVPAIDADREDIGINP